eukprot:GHVN01013767.1.p1 GENE.GHVN01013767.1~~GHVN01013767.1.p1  ORF type:complete len:690 (-),score=63.75 GHVN01013767.1:87-2069(-)
MDKDVSEIFKDEDGFTPPYYNYEEEAEMGAGLDPDMSGGSSHGNELSCQEHGVQMGFGAFRKLGHVWSRYDSLSRFVDVGHPLFNNKFPMGLVQEGNHELSIFRDVDRCRLLKTEINHYLNIDYMKSQKFIFSEFALHQLPNLKILTNEWSSWTKCDTSQDILLVRNYFGEAMAFYFAYLQFYTDLLIWPAVIGFILWAIEWIPMKNMHKNGMNCLYAFYISLWTSWFLERWTRREALHRYQWGMETDMPDRILAERPDFREEKYVANPVNPYGNRVKYYPWWKRLLRRFFTSTVTALCLIFVIGCVVVVFYVQTEYLEVWVGTPQRAEMIASYVNASLVAIFERIWRYAAYALVRFENHQYERDFASSIVIKYFLVALVNNFNAVFYLAFAKQYLFKDSKGCFSQESGECLSQLTRYLWSTFLLNLSLNAVEIGYPYVAFWCRNRKRNVEESSWTEDQNNREPYTDDDLLEEFMEIVLQFSFVALFSVALPIMPLLAFASNVVEIRSDATKLCRYYRRPFPMPAKGIRAWTNIMRAISIMGVMVNIGLAVFSYDLCASFGWTSKIAIFLVTEHVVFLVKGLLLVYIAEEPSDMTLAKEKTRAALHEAIWGKTMESGHRAVNRQLTQGDLHSGFPVETKPPDRDYQAQRIVSSNMWKVKV